MAMAEEVLMELMMIVDDEEPITEEVTQKLNALADSICTEGPPTRDVVLDLGAYVAVCRSWIFCCFNGVESISLDPEARSCRDAVLRVLYALTPGHADIIDDVGWQIVIQGMEKTTPERSQILLVKLLRNMFVRCEPNREYFVDHLKLLPQLVQFIFKPKLSSEFLCEWCGALKALLLNDDVTVASNKSSERKAAIAKTKVLPTIVGRLVDRTYEKDPGTLNAVVILLTSFAVSENLCEELDSGNIIGGMRSMFKNHGTDKTLVRNTIKLLRHFCSSHTLREKVATFGMMKWVIDAITKYKRYKYFVEEGMSCCAHMTLRSSCHVAQFFAKNGLPLTMQIMTDFKDNISILKSSCVVLRNVAENMGLYGKEKLRELGFDILLSQFKSTLLELKEFYVLPVLKEIEKIDTRMSIAAHSHHLLHPHQDKPPVILDNALLEPVAGRKSIVLDVSDDERE